MAWWETAPVVNKPTAGQWWETAPVVDRRINDTTGLSGPPGNPWQQAAETLEGIQQAPATEFGPLQKPESGMILPVSSDERGKVSFDPNAGILGPFTRAIKTTQEVGEGKLDPMSAQAIPKELEAALIISPTSVASTAGRAATVPVKQKAPSAEALRSAASQGYKKVDDLGVNYSSDAVKSFADDVTRALDEEGFIAELSPKTAAILKKLREPPEGAVSSSVRSLDAFRKQLGRIRESTDNTESAAANIVIRKLDDWLANPNPSSLVVGAPAAQATGAANVPRLGGAAAPSAEEVAKQAAATLKDARGNTAAAFRSDRITGLEESAANRAAASNSGRNLGNTIRQRLASLLESDKKTSGFSDEELAAIQQVVDGTATTNTLRYVGNLLGAGGGLGQSVIAALSGAGGAAAGGIPGAAVGAAVPTAVGAASRTGYNRLTLGQLRALDELIRQRSPLYSQALQNPQMTYSAMPDLGAAYARALAMQSLGQP